MNGPSYEKMRLDHYGRMLGRLHGKRRMPEPQYHDALEIASGDPELFSVEERSILNGAFSTMRQKFWDTPFASLRNDLLHRGARSSLRTRERFRRPISRRSSTITSFTKSRRSRPVVGRCYREPCERSFFRSSWSPAATACSG